METFKSKEKEKVMSSKAKKRLESKKAKACAFLAVARLNDAQKTERKQKNKLSNENKDSSDEDRISDSGENNKTDEMQQNMLNRDESQHCNGHSQLHSPDGAPPQKTTINDEAAWLNEEEFAALKSRLRARQKASLQKPKLYLCLKEMISAEPAAKGIDNGEKMGQVTELPPLFILDLQSLLLYAVMGDRVSHIPRWCKLLRWTKVSHIMVVIVKGLSITEYKKYPQCFPKLSSLFDMSVEMMTPSQYGSTVLTELFNVPLSNKQIDQLAIYARKKERKEEDTKETNVSMTDSREGGNRPCSRLSLVLGIDQLIAEGYPLPVVTPQYSHFVFSKSDYKTLSEDSPMYAVDCEMVKTTTHKLELARVSVVNEDCEVIYDTLVKPHNKVIDYLTRYSGITEKMLRTVTTRLSDVQEKLQTLLPADAIWIGQSLNSDLFALQMLHPYIIDTSVIYNLSGRRSAKVGLKRLTAMFLGYDIQNHGMKGHSSSEDSTACMKLVQLKLQKGLDFGDACIYDVGNLHPYANPIKNEEKCLGKRKLCDRPQSKEDTKDLHINKKLRTEGGTGSMSNTPASNLSASDAWKNTRLRRKIFFQNHGKSIFHDFLDIVKEQKNAVTLIQRQETVTKNPVNNAEQVPCQSDKEAVITTRSLAQDKKFTITNLHHFKENWRSESPDKEKQEILKKIDKNIGKLHKSAADSSLMVVVFGGRVEDEECHNALCCVKIVKQDVT